MYGGSIIRSVVRIIMLKMLLAAFRSSATSWARAIAAPPATMSDIPFCRSLGRRTIASTARWSVQRVGRRRGVRVPSSRGALVFSDAPVVPSALRRMPSVPPRRVASGVAVGDSTPRLRTTARTMTAEM